MCLVLLAYKTHPHYKMVIAANRDEFYDRPTRSAHFWDDQENVLAGKDLKAGGTWMGVNRNGDFGLITNYRDPDNIKPNAPSRGKLVSDYLIGRPNPKNYLETLDLISEKYNGYNIILGNPEDLWYYSNIGGRIYMLGSGIYGLSNSLLDTPWPKVQKGKEVLKNLLNNERIDPQSLLTALYDNEFGPDDQLPDTGVGLEKERVLSPMFIKSPGYGTRCTTVLLIDRHDNLTFVERTYDVTTFEHETNYFNLDVSREIIE